MLNLTCQDGSRILLGCWCCSRRIILTLASSHLFLSQLLDKLLWWQLYLHLAVFFTFHRWLQFTLQMHQSRLEELSRETYLKSVVSKLLVLILSLAEENKSWTSLSVGNAPYKYKQWLSKVQDEYTIKIAPWLLLMNWKCDGR